MITIRIRRLVLFNFKVIIKFKLVRIIPTLIYTEHHFKLKDFSMVCDLYNIYDSVRVLLHIILLYFYANSPKEEIVGLNVLRG